MRAGEVQPQAVEAPGPEPALTDGGVALPAAFYARDAVRVARALLGKIVVHEGRDGIAAGRIVEVEAYRGPGDRAAHSAGGRRTPRNEVMWGPPGRAYVYFIYGMHWCLNAVTSPEGRPEAVLLRALEPLSGLDLMRRRRRTSDSDRRLLSGPANLCRGLGVDRVLNGASLTEGPLRILDAPPVPAARVRRTVRIGVEYAGEDARLPYRLVVAGSPSLSGPSRLRP